MFLATKLRLALIAAELRFALRLVFRSKTCIFSMGVARFKTDSDMRGFSLIELITAIAIIAVLSMLTIRTFHALQAKKTLDAESARVVTEFERARSLTLSSKNEEQYGVHVESTQVTLFETATFVVGSSTNIVTILNPPVTIPAIALSGGGADVIFSRLTGKTAQSGTITLTETGTGSKVITIYPTGIAEVQ